MNKSKGFTLIELMIVLVVACIIALFIVMQYSNQTRKAKIAMGEDRLRETAGMIEKMRMQGKKYSDPSIKEAFDELLVRYPRSNKYGFTYSDESKPIYEATLKMTDDRYFIKLVALGDWIDSDSEDAVMCINSYSVFRKGLELCRFEEDLFDGRLESDVSSRLTPGPGV